jgi:hypothetical protein
VEVKEGREAKDREEGGEGKRIVKISTIAWEKGQTREAEEGYHEYDVRRE